MSRADDSASFLVAGRPIDWDTFTTVLAAFGDECLTIARLDEAGTPLVHVTPAFEALTGYTAEEALGRDLHFLERRDGDLQGDAALRSAVAEGRSYRRVARNYRKDGALFWNEQSHYPLSTATRQGSDGRPSHLISLQRDVSDRVRAQGALDASETMNRLIPGDGTYFSYGVALHENDEMTLDWLTRAFEQLTGYSAEDVQTLDFRNLFHPDDYRMLCKRTLALKRNEPRVDRFRLLTRYGQPIWVEDFATPVYDAQAGRVVAIQGAARDITGAMRAEHDLRQMASFDTLTGLPNRQLLESHLDQAIQQADRRGSHLVVAFLDLDNFKMINDTRGHGTGDIVIEEVARRLRQTVRAVDTVARWGGDEFILLLPDLQHSRAALPVLESVLERVSEPYSAGNVTFHLSVSIGVDVYPDSGQDVSALIKHADTALFRAKESGRNTVRFFEPQMNERMQHRLSLEAELRQAIARDQLTLYYQPRIDLLTGRLTSAEALLRWLHPERGLIRPGSFIPLAEETNFIVDIFRAVIDMACRQARLWAEHTTPQRVAVNISPLTLRQDRFIDMVGDALARHGLHPSLLEIEITETAAMMAVEDSGRKLADLRAMGVHVSLDDFGVAYSSLSHLRKLPLDSLKIDRSFLKEVGDDRNGGLGHERAQTRSILQAIIALGKSLGLIVVAEGVETSGQNQLLRGLHCDEGQGYLYGRPVPPEQLTSMLEHRGR